MTTVISILTPSKIGIWNIPMRGQNFINNYYANMNNYKIGLVYQEGLMFKDFNMLKTIVKKNKQNKKQNSYYIYFKSTTFKFKTQ